MPLEMLPSDVLLVIDVQNDFCPGGALAVQDGDAVVPVVNRLLARFPHVLLTQDWHTSGHSSFASSHAGRKAFESIEVSYGLQTLWPDHCVQGSTGAEFHPHLDRTRAELVLRKGFRMGIDSYSAFEENDHRTKTGLGGYMRERGFSRIFLAGLAYDYCVRYSAIDARREGFEAVVVEDACRAIGLNGSVEETRQAFHQYGVRRLSSEEIF